MSPYIELTTLFHPLLFAQWPHFPHVKDDGVEFPHPAGAEEVLAGSGVAHGGIHPIPGAVLQKRLLTKAEPKVFL